VLGIEREVQHFANRAELAESRQRHGSGREHFAVAFFGKQAAKLSGSTVVAGPAEGLDSGEADRGCRDRAGPGSAG